MTAPPTEAYGGSRMMMRNGVMQGIFEIPEMIIEDVSGVINLLPCMNPGSYVTRYEMISTT